MSHHPTTTPPPATNRDWFALDLLHAVEHGLTFKELVRQSGRPRDTVWLLLRPLVRWQVLDRIASAGQAPVYRWTEETGRLIAALGEPVREDTDLDTALATLAGLLAKARDLSRGRVALETERAFDRLRDLPGGDRYLRRAVRPGGAPYTLLELLDDLLSPTGTTLAELVRTQLARPDSVGFDALTMWLALFESLGLTAPVRHQATARVHVPATGLQRLRTDLSKPESVTDPDYRTALHDLRSAITEHGQLTLDQPTAPVMARLARLTQVPASPLNGLPPAPTRFTIGDLLAVLRAQPGRTVARLATLIPLSPSGLRLWLDRLRALGMLEPTNRVGKRPHTLNNRVVEWLDLAERGKPVADPQMRDALFAFGNLLQVVSPTDKRDSRPFTDTVRRLHAADPRSPGTPSPIRRTQAKGERLSLADLTRRLIGGATITELQQATGRQRQTILKTLSRLADLGVLVKDDYLPAPGMEKLFIHLADPASATLDITDPHEAQLTSYRAQLGELARLLQDNCALYSRATYEAAQRRLVRLAATEGSPLHRATTDPTTQPADEHNLVTEPRSLAGSARRPIERTAWLPQATVELA